MPLAYLKGEPPMILLWVLLLRTLEGEALPVEMRLWVRSSSPVRWVHSTMHTSGLGFPHSPEGYCGGEIISFSLILASKPQDDLDEIDCSICFAKPTSRRGNLSCFLEVYFLFLETARIREKKSMLNNLSCFLLKYHCCFYNWDIFLELPCLRPEHHIIRNAH